MPIPVSCPQCHARYNLKDDLAGKALRCKQCQGVIQVPSAGFQEGLPAAPLDRPTPAPIPGPPVPAIRPGPPPLPAARDRDEDDYDRPPRRRDDYDDRDDRAYDDRDYDDRDDEPHPWDELDPAFQRDKFLLRQKHFSISEKYYIQDEAGRNILFVERPMYFTQGCAATMVALLSLVGVVGLFLLLGYAVSHPGNRGPIMAGLGVLGGFVGLLAFFVLLIWLYPKRHVQFFADDSKRDLLLEVLQDKKFMPINATYTIIDPDGKVIARLRKNYLYNFFRRRWYIYYPDGELMSMAMEDSLILSLLRRFFGYWVAIFFRTNFIITKRDSEKVIGEFIRKFTILDRYVLDMSRDRNMYMDRRVAVALGIMLDTGEHR